MTYPPSGGTPDPYQPYGQQQGYDQSNPYAPAGGQPYGQVQPYSAQPYSAQPYSTQPYSAQPYGQPYGPGYAMPAPTNTMAILALVFGFVMPIAGVILGHMARKQIKQTGEQGDGMALAGLIISYLHLAVWALICAFYVVIVVGFFGLFAAAGASAGG